jgi:hypothetical protein
MDNTPLAKRVGVSTVRVSSVMFTDARRLPPIAAAGGSM